jgi:two-component sensor histidine kinase
MSVPGGRVHVRWQLGGGALKWTWQEVGGPTITAAPERKGFGTVLIQHVLAEDFRGEVGMTYEGGLVCELHAPEPSLDMPSH